MSISTNVAGNTGTINMTGRFDFNVQREFKEAYDFLISSSAVGLIDVNLSGVKSTCSRSSLSLSAVFFPTAQIFKAASSARPWPVSSKRRKKKLTPFELVNTSH